jgi:hypothetical protein
MSNPHVLHGLSSSFCTGEWERKRKDAEDDFPTLDDLLELSDGGDKHTWLCGILLPFVVGFKKWMKSFYKERLSDVAMCSDETLFLLTLENHWTDEAACG